MSRTLPNAYSPSKIDTLLCLRKYYYEYIKPKKKEQVIDTNIALGLFFHKMVEMLWTGLPGSLRHKYKSKESYINSASAYFKRYIAKTDSYQGRNIEWTLPHQKWILINSLIPEVLRNYYDLTLKENPPLALEVPFKIMADGKIYNGRIDEIRKNGDLNLVIRDHKYLPNSIPKEMEKTFNPQFTVYAFALAGDLREHGPISKLLGFSKDHASQIAGNNITSENITLEYHLFKQNTIIPATRVPEHYLDIRDTVIGLDEKIENAYATGNFYAQRGNHCDYCLHRKRCYNDTLNTGDNTLIAPQLQLFQIDHRFQRRKSRDQLNIKFPVLNSEM